MKKELEFWVLLANGDSVYCETESEKEKAQDSLIFLYDLIGKTFQPKRVSAPCYVRKEKNEYAFCKKPLTNGDVINMSEL